MPDYSELSNKNNSPKGKAKAGPYRTGPHTVNVSRMSSRNKTPVHKTVMNVAIESPLNSDLEAALDL